MVAVADILPGDIQPRRIFDEGEMDSLIKSVSEKGVLQPVLLRPASKGNGFEIVAGERRWRAAQAARLHEIPAVVRDLDDRTALEVALIENLQRDALSILEEAEGYQKLASQYGHSQDDIGRAVGKSRSHVANTLRLLSLSDAVKKLIDEGKLTAGHARTLVGAEDPDGLARVIISRGLNVRQSEKLAATRGNRQGSKPQARRPQQNDADIRELERKLSEGTGIRARTSFDGQGGQVTLKYSNLDQLDDLIIRLLGTS
jgi:ParB family chromosome partitioning protein